MALRQIILLGRRTRTAFGDGGEIIAGIAEGEGGREGVGAAVMRFLDT